MFGEEREAAGAVAAHFTHRAVGVEKSHFEVPALLCRLHSHEAVCPNGKPAAAESPCHTPQAVRTGFQGPVVYDNKVVAGSVHLPKFHGKASQHTKKMGLF